MTPERAAELALIYANNYFRARMYEDATRLSMFVEEAILAACKEQQEADAKIMDEAAEDVEEWSLYAPSYFKDKWNAELTIQKWRDRAKAIRSGA